MTIEIPLGMHLGLFSLQLSIGFRSPDGFLRADPALRSAYGIEGWSARYRGAIPALWHSPSKHVGYEVLDQPDEEPLSAFDSTFFHALLQEDASEALHRTVWSNLYKSIRRHHLRTQGAVHLVTYLEGVDFSQRASQWMPWVRSPDRRSEIESALQAIGVRYGINSFTLAREREVLESYLDNCLELAVSDLVLIIGHQTKLWRIKRSKPLDLEPLQRSEGLVALQQRLNKRDSSLVLELVGALNSPTDQTAPHFSEPVRAWLREVLEPDLRAHWSLTSGTRLWVGGEGAMLLHQLIDAATSKSRAGWLPEGRSALAQGAALLAHQMLETGNHANSLSRY